MTVHGNLTGLKANQLAALSRMEARRVPPSRIITPEFAAVLCMLSREIGRQIGVFIDRRGQVTDVAVGDFDRIMLPDFGRVRGGEGRFRGLRFIHTHLRQEPLSREDMTDLTKLRLDMIAALGVSPEGVPGSDYLAHLLPPSATGALHRVLGPLNPGALPDDFILLIESLEAEFAKQVSGRKVTRENRAILIHVATNRQRLPEARRSLDELAELARSAGLDVADRILQVRDRPDRRFVLGEGKLEDVVVRAMQEDAELLIMDCNLSGNQARAIADKTELKVIDRTQLILEIFAQRATSADGRLKVELAQLKYLIPRLGAKDDSLSRLTGGIGGRKGPGETKMEIGRRRAKERVGRLQARLAQLAKGRAQRRVRRQKSELPIVSIVGYTNAGKSTLLNALTRSDVPVEDRLFATLETASRRLRFPRDREIIVTDTVGFIRDLPPDLVDAFKATLEELQDATLLLHVVDIGDPAHREHIVAVEKILAELALSHIPRLFVFNKADLVEEGEVLPFVEAEGGVLISARNRQSLHPLLSRIEQHIWHRAKD